MKKAWQIERELRVAAVPVDRRVNQSHYNDEEAAFNTIPAGDDLLRLFWESKVPGSYAPEIPYLEMVQAAYTKGYDTTQAERILPRALDLAKSDKIDELRAVTAELLEALNNAHPDPQHPCHRFEHPATWLEVKSAMGKVQVGPIAFDKSDLKERIYQGWLGQLSGGSFGTALEGYTGEQLTRLYGDIRTYICPPETTNDDVVYELVLLDVFEKLGKQLNSHELAVEWIKQIPFGWSAEWIALRNLSMGIFPPQSGSFMNPYSNWIGAQMRGMICGMLAPGWPMEAARLAHIDGEVSHDNNGVYGEMFAAVLTSLAFVRKDPRALLVEAAEYVPQKSFYASVLRDCLAVVSSQANPLDAWKILDDHYKEYNWIDAHPNIAAVIVSLWYGKLDMTECFSVLAKCGLDVDCNGGLVGNVLGVIQPVPEQWASPLGDLLETYLPGKAKLSIKELADRTASLAL
ncbi:MAG: ADP-ribosylglycohydrolase family protein [Anaerolineaceae bacterium]